MDRRRILAMVLMTGVVLAGRAAGATNCEQRFALIGRTKGACPTFWIAEDLSGECHQSHLLQVVLAGGRAMLVRSELELQKDWDWLRRDMGRFRTEAPIKLVRVGDTWRTKGVTWYVRGPEEKPSLGRAFDEHIRSGGSGAASWNGKRGAEGVVPPRVDGFDAELVYYYGRGLYVNYDIAQVFYFPETGYLLVFTEQKKRAVGLDTMHGFMLLRRVKAEEETSKK